MYKQISLNVFNLSCIIILTLLILLFSSCSDDTSISIATPTSVPTFGTDTVQKMEQVMDKYMENLHIPGVVVGVWVPGQGTWIKAKGKGNISTGQDLKYDDRFRIGSITKTFTVTVLLQLVDEGKINLDDTLDKYISSVPNGKNITIRELCNMSAGLYNYTDDPDFVEVYQTEPLHKWMPQELVNIAISHDPYFPPGEMYHYSNTNTILVGMIIEKITGNTLDAEVRNRIITPLGLRNTSFDTTPYMTGQYSHGYIDPNNDGNLMDVTEADPSCAWSAGAIVSTLDDMYIWAKAVAEGNLLSEKTQKERLTWGGQPMDPNWGKAMSYGKDGITDLPKADTQFKYCLGIFYFGNFLGHNGQIRGYNGSMYYLPSKKSVFIVFSNNGKGADAIFQEISKIVLPDDVSW